MKQSFLFPIFFLLLPLMTLANAGDLIEKHYKVLMRTIGHEVLMQLKDSSSRVLPIEKIEQRYKIPFEKKLGFDPALMVHVIDSVMKSADIQQNYLVEVEQCETKEIVHSYIYGPDVDPSKIACGERGLPKDCYALLLTFLAEEEFMLARGNTPEIMVSTTYITGDQLTTPSQGAQQSLFVLLGLVVLSFLGGFIFFKIKKKNTPVNPDLIFIGAFQFDKKNMALSFQDKKVELSNKESELLTFLHASANRPLKREDILQRVWGDEGDYIGRTLDVFISKLRKKLASDTSVKIVNIRGVGYKLVMDN